MHIGRSRPCDASLAGDSNAAEVTRLSEQNVKLHRQVVDAFNARDVEALIALTDPDVEYHPALRTAVAGPTAYRGHEGLRSWFDDFDEVWGDQIRIEPNAYFDLGEQTLMSYVLWGRGRSSGAEVTMDFTQVIKWRDSLILYSKVYTDRDEALSDLGVSEDALEPIAP
jgi:ketosteroid isomerase-like protein